MEFTELVKALSQYYEAAQTGGALTLEHSYNVKKSVMSLLNDGKDAKDRDAKLKNLLSSVALGQKKGVYSSDDVLAYFDILSKLEKCLDQ